MLWKVAWCSIGAFASGCGLLLDVGLADEDAGAAADGSDAFDAAVADAAGEDASAADATPVDARSRDGSAVDAGPTRCIEWGLFEPPREIVEVNSLSAEFSPSLTADRLEMFFSSGRGGNENIWVARRASVSDPFGMPSEVEELSTSESEQDPDISPDGLSLLFTRAGRGIWETKRTTRSDPFASPVRLAIEFGADEPSSYGGSNFADDQTLYFSVGPWSPMLYHDIFVATRPSADRPWSATRVDALSTSEHEGFPSISSDQLELFFDARRHVGDLDLYVARRASTADPWDSATAVLGAADLGPTEQDPDISADGSTLCFDRDMGSSGSFDIWCMTRACSATGP